MWASLRAQNKLKNIHFFICFVLLGEGGWKEDHPFQLISTQTPDRKSSENYCREEVKRLKEWKTTKEGRKPKAWLKISLSFPSLLPSTEPSGFYWILICYKSQ